MAIVESPEYMPLDMEEDPDDYRPSSHLAVVVDPARPGRPHVQGLTVFCEKIAAGDRIPLHKHLNEDEVLFVADGAIEATVGEETRRIGVGAVVFIPAGVLHGFRNVGDGVARIQAVFPSREVSIEYAERNPAPGTEGDAPGPPIALDARELLEGDPQKAVRVLSD